VDILIDSVDTANCASLVSLADQLQLFRLFEAALNHMVKTLGNLQDHELWNDLNPELQQCIQTIQRLLLSHNTRGGIGSSNHNHVHLKSVYFSTFTEYLAIFAEQVEYYKERLEEAKREQARHKINGGGGKAWEYAQTKIKQHEIRVCTLETAMVEQRKLFGTSRQPSNGGDDHRRRSGGGEDGTHDNDHDDDNMMCHVQENQK
jgi:hypothetical protein